jgi:nucleoid DNA-binding protein
MMEKTTLNTVAGVVAKKVDCSCADVYAVLKIVFEELLTDLKNGIERPIIGFGKFSIRHFPDREHNDLKTHARIVSPGRNNIRFKLDTGLTQTLLTNLSRRKTFPPNN